MMSLLVFFRFQIVIVAVARRVQSATVKVVLAKVARSEDKFQQNFNFFKLLICIKHFFLAMLKM